MNTDIIRKDLYPTETLVKKSQEIYGTVQELENYLGSSTKYQDELKELETCSMDPAESEKNVKELLDLHETIQDIAGTFH